MKHLGITSQSQSKSEAVTTRKLAHFVTEVFGLSLRQSLGWPLGIAKEPFPTRIAILTVVRTATSLNYWPEKEVYRRTSFMNDGSLFMLQQVSNP